MLVSFVFYLATAALLHAIPHDKINSTYTVCLAKELLLDFGVRDVNIRFSSLVLFVPFGMKRLEMRCKRITSVCILSSAHVSVEMR